MGIRINHDFDEDEDDYRNRRNKRVRISEDGVFGNSIFFPTSDRVPPDLQRHRSNESALETIVGHRGITRRPLDRGNDQITTLRRRNAIRRGMLRNYPSRHTFGPLRRDATSGLNNDTHSLNGQQQSDHSLLALNLDSTSSSRHERGGHFNNLFQSSMRGDRFNLWQSTDDILNNNNNNNDDDDDDDDDDEIDVHDPNHNYDADDIDERRLDSPARRFYDSTRDIELMRRLAAMPEPNNDDNDDDDEVSESSGRVLPVIPPPLPPRYYLLQLQQQLFGVLPPPFLRLPIINERHYNQHNAFVTFEYNQDSSSILSTTTTTTTPPPPLLLSDNTSPFFEKFSLPHIDNLISDEEQPQRLSPRDDQLLIAKANEVSRLKYGKLMASGVIPITRTKSKSKSKTKTLKGKESKQGNINNNNNNSNKKKT